MVILFCGISANTRQANNRTRSAGPPYSRLIRYTIWVIKLDIFLSISDFCFLGRRQIYLREVFEIIGKYSAAACTRPGAFLEQVISTSGHRAQKLPNQIYTGVLQQHRRLFSATIFDFYWIFKRHVLPC